MAGRKLTSGNSDKITGAINGIYTGGRFGNIIQVSAGYVPGYWIGIFLPDWLGHRRQQFLGSATVTILYAVWAVPVEVFPTKVRATSHGIAAASGKIGAVVTSFAFNSATNTIGLNGVLGLLSGIMFFCTLLTYYVPEPKGLSLAEIEVDGMYKDKKGIAIETVSTVVVGSNMSEAPSYESDSAVAGKV
ncbi:hypothetical protein Sste5344_003097 [Sporothrix stenoceras]